MLEPRKRAEPALVATVREAYVQGVAQLLDEAEDEVLTYLSFPTEHWRHCVFNWP
jgi:transposase-like protein